MAAIFPRPQCAKRMVQWATLVCIYHLTHKHVNTAVTETNHCVYVFVCVRDYVYMNIRIHARTASADYSAVNEVRLFGG